MWKRKSPSRTRGDAHHSPSHTVIIVILSFSSTDLWPLSAPCEGRPTSACSRRCGLSISRWWERPPQCLRSLAPPAAAWSWPQCTINHTHPTQRNELETRTPPSEWDCTMCLYPQCFCVLLTHVLCVLQRELSSGSVRLSRRKRPYISPKPPLPAEAELPVRATVLPGREREEAAGAGGCGVRRGRERL